jgi:branched-subunit amino acid transport protein
MLYLWSAIVGLTVITVLSRSVFLLAGARVQIPARIQRALRYAPPAALVAVILPELLTVQGAVAWSPLANPKLLASLLAGLWFVATRQMVSTIVVGMAVYTLLRLYVI